MSGSRWLLQVPSAMRRTFPVPPWLDRGLTLLSECSCPKMDMLKLYAQGDSAGRVGPWGGDWVTVWSPHDGLRAPTQEASGTLQPSAGGGHRERPPSQSPPLLASDLGPPAANPAEIPLGGG